MKTCRASAVVVILGCVATRAHAEGTPAEAEPGKPAAIESIAKPIAEETRRGEAQIEPAAPGWAYPKAMAARPLTMKKYMIRGSFSVDVKRASIDTDGIDGRPLAAIDIGGGFSPLDNLEVGISNYRLGSTAPIAGQSMFPVVVSPIGTFGDMPIYLRYSFLRKSYVELAVDFVLHIPTWTNLAATFGLPTRIRVRDTLTVDTGTELVVLANGAGLNVELPFKFTYNPRPAGFLFADSGLSFQNLARNVTRTSFYDTNLAFPVARNQVFVPLAVGGGYTRVVKNIVMIDIFARFGWNPFVYLNPPSGTNVGVVPVADSWLLAAGVLIHTSPILQLSD